MVLKVEYKITFESNDTIIIPNIYDNVLSICIKIDKGENLDKLIIKTKDYDVIKSNMGDSDIYVGFDFDSILHLKKLDFMMTCNLNNLQSVLDVPAELRKLEILRIPYLGTERDLSHLNSFAKLQTLEVAHMRDLKDIDEKTIMNHSSLKRIYGFPAEDIQDYSAELKEKLTNIIKSGVRLYTYTFLNLNKQYNVIHIEDFQNNIED